MIYVEISVIFRPSAFEKSALAESVVKSFPCLRDPDGISGFVSHELFYQYRISPLDYTYFAVFLKDMGEAAASVQKFARGKLQNTRFETIVWSTK